MKNIEEVKKILERLHEPCMDCEYYHTEDCYSCGGLCTRDIDATKAICQLFSQPDHLKLSHEANMRYGIPKSDVDDKDLEKKIDGILLEVFNDGFIYGELGKGKEDEKSIVGKADQILALIKPDNPDIKEV